MFWRVAVFALMVSSIAGANGAPTVRPLFEDASYLPGALIPFQMKGTAFNQGAKIISVSPIASAAADCRTMNDPFHQDVFHLKCAGATGPGLILRIRYESQSVLYTVDYGPLEVKALGGGAVAVPPETNIDPNFIVGRNLYNAYCLSCHTPMSKRGRSAEQIQSSINTNSSMRSISGLKNLKAVDLQNIELYLKTGGK